jgi:hypothetical protein
MAQSQADAAKHKKVRVHNPLGIVIDLARHLILTVPAVAA